MDTLTPTILPGIGDRITPSPPEVGTEGREIACGDVLIVFGAAIEGVVDAAADADSGSSIW